MKMIRFLVMAVAFGLLLVEPSYAVNFVCGEDTNGNGAVSDPGETASCASTPEGPLCPLGATPCSASRTAATCPPDGSLNTASDRCEAPRIFHLHRRFLIHWHCPLNYTYDGAGGVCVATPSCATGMYDPAGDQCLQGYSCPLGSQYSCMNNAGTYQCSSNACVDLDAAPPQTMTPNLTSYQNNGQADPATGLCQGPVFIFNGKASECRPAGAGTSFFNCCSNGSGDFLVFKKYCADAEWSTNASKDAQSCHYIGDYCKTSWPFIGCVQKAQVYCCFNSKLGRMIQEQGRGQLKKFAPDGQWGTTGSPNCVGFAPEEMQMLDFSQMDLSEYFANISSKSQSQINQGMENKVNEFYQNLRP